MKTMQHCSALAVSAVVAFAVFTLNAQSGGDALYKSKCLSCHGANGNPSPALAKSMNIKSANDPSIKKLAIDQIVATIRNGKNKMKPVGGLSNEQAKSVAAYFKLLGK